MSHPRQSPPATKENEKSPTSCLSIKSLAPTPGLASVFSKRSQKKGRLTRREARNPTKKKHRLEKRNKKRDCSSHTLLRVKQQHGGTWKEKKGGETKQDRWSLPPSPQSAGEGLLPREGKPEKRRGKARKKEMNQKQKKTSHK